MGKGAKAPPKCIKCFPWLGVISFSLSKTGNRFSTRMTTFGSPDFVMLELLHKIPYSVWILRATVNKELLDGGCTVIVRGRMGSCILPFALCTMGRDCLPPQCVQSSELVSGFLRAMAVYFRA